MTKTRKEKFRQSKKDWKMDRRQRRRQKETHFVPNRDELAEMMDYLDSRESK